MVLPVWSIVSSISFHLEHSVLSLPLDWQPSRTQRNLGSQHALMVMPAHIIILSSQVQPQKYAPLFLVLSVNPLLYYHFISSSYHKVFCECQIIGTMLSLFP